MIPFFDIFGFTLPGYGMSLGIGVLVSYGLAGWLGTRSRLGNDHATTLYLFAGLGAVAGSRLLQLVVERHRFTDGIINGLMRPEGGIWYGALLGAIVTTIVYARIRKLSPFLTLDVMAPAWAIGHAFGRMGCYLGGCCFGTPTHGPLGVSFPRNSAAYFELENHDPTFIAEFGTVPLIPIQLFEAAGELALVGLLAYLFFKKLPDGVVFLTYAGSYSIMRFILEWWRFDPVRGWVIEGWLSTSQLIAVGMLAVAIGFAVRLRKKAAAVV